MKHARILTQIGLSKSYNFLLFIFFSSEGFLYLERGGYHSALASFERALEIQNSLYNKKEFKILHSLKQIALPVIKELQGFEMNFSPNYLPLFIISAIRIKSELLYVIDLYNRLGLLKMKEQSFEKALETFEKGAKLYEIDQVPRETEYGMLKSNVGAVYIVLAQILSNLRLVSDFLPFFNNHRHYSMKRSMQTREILKLL